ncbi:MAG: hypothetical protein A2381_19745 [Bdellovibrionales bacterium RIFOXYB1_FULL_37_110]|nr:MAG: hypothetical protein A2181_06590 [Bdellovibrionales bacterium RIFOXYA1_FULL_38_20]OFZ45470.1 MAG: hypothetical protein A2417_18070 [Bdellovibrionales bacterium RIFOXYC1_FULL_37_79]OFZ55086.1 MAG: hypothetical protein A2328_09325 [Bdellovibrionales bacterium RIFOXYB2_FULL_36_6]OFZ61016.1 MAG: hypothetical protein A2381_19745 [Bdellovibrionales bacterium RIFOXYB1_FULL_37_110]OFZ63467.1 MAG: hypothetical protein A2577_06265 [Bdellovibrionales bacterium RIFOXYD1_FULL_36_51]
MEKKYIAGMDIRGGRNDDFYCSLLEYYPGGQRIFLKSLLQLKDENSSRDTFIKDWADKYELSDIVVDCPLVPPVCTTCALECPGEKKCPEVTIVEVRKKINILLHEDEKKRVNHPKEYERNRNICDEIEPARDILRKSSKDHMLSRSFKKRLKKDILPYWNRPLDFWIWCNYYDALLDIFKTSYDSFGHSSMMLVYRVDYLKRHFPRNFNLFESDVDMVLIELLRAQIVTRSDLTELNIMGSAGLARLNILKSLEEKLNLFIYDHEKEILVKRPKAFESLLLALAGYRYHLGKTVEMPWWTRPGEVNFILPVF